MWLNSTYKKPKHLSLLVTWMKRWGSLIWNGKRPHFSTFLWHPSLHFQANAQSNHRCMDHKTWAPQMPPDKSLYTSTSSNQNFADTDKKSVQIIISLTLFGKCLANIPASGFLASLSSSNCTFNSQIWPRLPKALNSIYAPSLMSRSTLKITLKIIFLFLDFFFVIGTQAVWPTSAIHLIIKRVTWVTGVPAC